MKKNNIFLFWSTYKESESIDEWRNRKMELSDLHFLSLFSNDISGDNIFLYTYQNIKKSNLNAIYKNIKVVDADIVFPCQKAFKSLTMGHSIAHISDLIRLTEASTKEGVVLDMDGVRINPFPDKSGWMASVPAKLTGGFAPKWGDAHPPITINDNSWNGKALSNFPCKINKRTSSFGFKLISEIKSSLCSMPKNDSKAWNYVMWALKEIPLIYEDIHVYPPISFGPLPAWLGPGKCYSLEYPHRFNGKEELFGYKLPHIDEILEKSYIVQHFFESAFKKSGINTNLWENINDGCLLAIEAETILERNWRQELKKMKGVYNGG